MQEVLLEMEMSAGELLDSHSGKAGICSLAKGPLTSHGL